jgi:hypothetical protein
MARLSQAETSASLWLQFEAEPVICRTDTTINISPFGLFIKLVHID